jgi:acetyl-CoA C-acetyltransferase
MKLARDVVLIDYLRSPFSRSRPKDPEKDLFSKHRMDEVCALLIKEIIKRTGIVPAIIDECVTGTAQPVLETYTGGGRYPVLLAELPVKVASQQVDTACGSSFNGVRTAVMSIASGFSEVVLACGIEHMTHVPMNAPNAIIPPLHLWVDEKYKALDMMNVVSNGLTAEKLLATKTKYTREDMDKFALRSHQLAAKARNEGYFKGEILPIEITLADGSKQVFDYDASVKADTTIELLRALKPV